MPQENRKAGAGGLLFAILFYIALPAIFMWISGNWLWVQGLIFAGWFFVTCETIAVWLFIRNPYLFAERLKPGKGNQKPWDKVFLILLEIVFVAWYVLMPLDASRFGWSPEFPLWLHILGGVMLLGATYLFFKCYADNPYLAAVVRIQDDRGQKVISTGIYGVMRHPLYLGGVLLFVGTPLLLGSLVGVGSTVIFVAGLIIRIFGEEKMLLEELEGYAQYKTKVRYRILPYIW
jgi:protein-S-isoprenylcysteine O-methyltransferase Ste14